MSQLKLCEKCGFSVEWRQKKDGKFYLVTDRGGSGHFKRIPHYLECKTLQEKRQRWEQQDNNSEA